MKQTSRFWMLAAILTICGASVFISCTSNDDNPALPSQQEMEASLIGLWYEGFAYEDVTEDGKPFNRALMGVSSCT